MIVIISSLASAQVSLYEYWMVSLQSDVSMSSRDGRTRLSCPGTALGRSFVESHTVHCVSLRILASPSAVIRPSGMKSYARRIKC
jgi:hypothetical protein